MEAVLAWRHSYGEDPETLAAAVEATRLLEPALIETVRERRDHPRDDAISFLWTQGREVADDWGEQDVLDNAKFLFEGGSETTAFLVCNAVHRLFDLPEAERDRRRWPTRMRFGRFLEEVLRHTTVVHLRARRAPRTWSWAGSPSGPASGSSPINAAANRDPARWERPDVFDPGRPRLFGHLAFNVGPRHCVGAHLARMEATEAILGLWRAFPDLRLAAEAPTTAHGRLRVAGLAPDPSRPRARRRRTSARDAGPPQSRARSQASRWIRVAPPSVTGGEVRVSRRPLRPAPSGAAGPSRPSWERGSSRHGAATTSPSTSYRPP